MVCAVYRATGASSLTVLYSLGKAERVMVGLRALAPLHVDAVLAFAEIYASQGVAMPATCPITWIGLG